MVELNQRNKSFDRVQWGRDPRVFSSIVSRLPALLLMQSRGVSYRKIPRRAWYGSFNRLKYPDIHGKDRVADC